jgi:hypothetical protein
VKTCASAPCISYAVAATDVPAPLFNVRLSSEHQRRSVRRPPPQLVCRSRLTRKIWLNNGNFLFRARRPMAPTLRSEGPTAMNGGQARRTRMVFVPAMVPGLSARDAM